MLFVQGFRPTPPLVRHAVVKMSKYLVPIYVEHKSRTQLITGYIHETTVVPGCCHQPLVDMKTLLKSCGLGRPEASVRRVILHQYPTESVSAF